VELFRQNKLVNEPLPPELHELIERLKVQREAEKSEDSGKPEESPQEPFISLPSFRTAQA
jgi:hypothetical protein